MQQVKTKAGPAMKRIANVVLHGQAQTVGASLPMFASEGCAFASNGYLKKRTNVSELKRYFDHSLLEAPDSYYPKEQRYRRYGVLFRDDWNVWRLLSNYSTFQQASTVNSHLGGITREYQPLTMNLVSHSAYQGLLNTFIDSLGTQSKDIKYIHCHQIKVCANEASTQITPEGIHQDGFDVVAIACVRRIACAGASNSLRESRQADPFLQEVLLPDDMLIFNDRRFWHDVSPMLPIGFPGARAFRDIFVIHATRHDPILHGYSEFTSPLSPPAITTFPHLDP